MSAVREAAQAVVDDMGPDRGTSMSDWVKLRDALALLRRYEEVGERINAAGREARANYSDDDFRGPST